MRKPTEEYLKDPDPSIGGFIVPLVGPPGVGKTKALIRIARQHLKSGNLVLWRGTRQCQWAHFLANGEDVTLWNHDSIASFEAYVQGSKRRDISRREVDLQDKGVKVRSWQEPEELVENLELDRVNVVNVPGLHGDRDYQRYFFRNMFVELADAQVTRNYGDFILNCWDEIGDIFPSQQQIRKPFSNLIRKLPPKLAQFRKNNCHLIGAGHGTHDMHYFLWKIKSNSIAYMSGATVKNSVSPSVDQKGVNSLSRGEIVMPGGDTARFVNESEMSELDWIPSSERRELRLDWEFDVPNLLETEDDKDVSDTRKISKGKAAKIVYKESANNPDMDSISQKTAGELFGVTQPTVADA